MRSAIADVMAFNSAREVIAMFGRITHQLVARRTERIALTIAMVAITLVALVTVSTNHMPIRTVITSVMTLGSTRCLMFSRIINYLFTARTQFNTDTSTM